MPVSRNKHVSNRGNHRQRVMSHDAYLSEKYPAQFNMTNPYSAVVAEMMDEELMESESVVDNTNMECPVVELVEPPVLEGEIVSEDHDATTEEIREAVQKLLIDGTLGTV